MKRLLNTKWTMKKKLIVYMIILALIIIFALFAGIMVIGRFDSAEKNIQNSLDFQMEALLFFLIQQLIMLIYCNLFHLLFFLEIRI